MSEQDCIIFLKERNLENPLYTKFSRLGCWMCPKQNLKSLKNLYIYYPNLWIKLKRYETDSPYGFRLDWTLDDLELRFKYTDEIINKFDINQIDKNFINNLLFKKQPELSQQIKKAIIKDCLNNNKNNKLKEN